MGEPLVLDHQTGEVITVDDAWNRHRRIVDLRNVAEKSFLALGEELYYFNELEQYKELSHPSMKSYLSDTEVAIGARLGFYLIDIYRTFTKRLGVKAPSLLDAGHSKLIDLLPYHSKGNITEGNANEWVNKAASLSQSDLRKELKESFPPRAAPPLPDGKYNIIYADPPWRYDFSLTDSRKIENQYPTMEVEDICALPVVGIIPEDCVLFLWATSPKLREALQVIEAWGFEYKTSMVWVKDKIGMGYYARQQHELLLIATYGSPDLPEPSVRPSSIIAGDRTEHSRKPTMAYEVIEQMYPEYKKIELFGRIKRAGWEVWGNEL